MKEPKECLGCGYPTWNSTEFCSTCELDMSDHEFRINAKNSAIDEQNYDDYQCPHRWREVVISGHDCSECEICHAVDC